MFSLRLYLILSCRIDSRFVDVSEKFYAAPKTWLASSDFMPSHIVMFDSLVKVSVYLCSRSYMH